MTVRVKITLLIAGSAFLCSLIFSAIIFWEMVRQPFRIIDSELNHVANEVTQLVYSKGVRPVIHRYWIEITDERTKQIIYRSELAQSVKIPNDGFEAKPKTIELIIPKESIELNQDKKDEVAFRTMSCSVSVKDKELLVKIGMPMETLEEEINHICFVVAGGLGFSLLFLFSLNYYVAGVMLTPLKHMNEKIKDIAEKHLDKRLPLRNTMDEFDTLAKTLNMLFDRLEHNLKRQKKLIADASHELKTPITLMRLVLEELTSLNSLDLDEIKEKYVCKLFSHVVRMEKLIKDILELSRLELGVTFSFKPLNLSKIIEGLLEDYSILAERKHIVIQKKVNEDLYVEGDEEKLRRAFSNVLDNAIKYNFERGWVDVTSEKGKDRIKVIVRNSGPGIPSKDIPKIFDQFFRVERSRSVSYGGIGLGLTITKGIIELHGGAIEVESREGGSTSFVVSLPIRVGNHSTMSQK